MIPGLGATQQVGVLASLIVALILSSLVGGERELRGKSAGLRTEAIVGTTAALMMIVGKYGFVDIVATGDVRFDPSRVAAQIVSGVSFLGAGLILTKSRGVIGLTTAATIWETAGIGMAAGAGLWVLAVAATVIHFVVVYALPPLARLIGDAMRWSGRKLSRNRDI